jgi:hypothetical protein
MEISVCYRYKQSINVLYNDMCRVHDLCPYPYDACTASADVGDMGRVNVGSSSWSRLEPFLSCVVTSSADEHHSY